MIYTEDSYQIYYPNCPLCNRSKVYSVVTVTEVNELAVTARIATMHDCAEDFYTLNINKRSAMYEAMNQLPPITTHN